LRAFALHITEARGLIFDIHSSFLFISSIKNVKYLALSHADLQSPPFIRSAMLTPSTPSTPTSPSLSTLSTLAATKAAESTPRHTPRPTGRSSSNRLCCQNGNGKVGKREAVLALPIGAEEGCGSINNVGLAKPVEGVWVWCSEDGEVGGGARAGVGE